MNTIVSREFRRTVVIDGRQTEQVLVLSNDRLQIRLGLDEEQATLGGQLGMTADLLAMWTNEAKMRDARYRAWRATAIRNQPGFKSEREEKAFLESAPEFLRHKEACAEAESNQLFLQCYFEALKAKGQQLSSMRYSARAREQAA